MFCDCCMVQLLYVQLYGYEGSGLVSAVWPFLRGLWWFRHAEEC